MLDVSRLLVRARFGPPTGIDRVEHAYAEHLPVLAPGAVSFVAVDRLGRLCRMPQAATQRFIAALGEHWAAGEPAVEHITAAARRLWLQALLPSVVRRPAAERAFYMLVSHRHLHRRRRVQSVLGASGARLVTFIHDLIPIEFPEYARASQRQIHLQRIRTAAALSAGVIVNSRVTQQSLAPYLAEAGRAPPVLVAPLGLGGRWAHAAAVAPAHPYFVFVSTIEPRKNHLLLLQIWRRLAERLGPAAPHLVVAGRRGWENENVVGFLERCGAIQPFVQERAAATDAAIGGLLHGARALLFPSFAEGFGLPVAEALASGVPVICSDLPSLREVGGDVPEYLDPIDGVAWLDAVVAYARDGSPRRAAQLERLAGWRSPAWPEHFAGVLALLTSL